LSNIAQKKTPILRSRSGNTILRRPLIRDSPPNSLSNGYGSHVFGPDLHFQVAL
jgi:hypothetical protein